MRCFKAEGTIEAEGSLRNSRVHLFKRVFSHRVELKALRREARMITFIAPVNRTFDVPNDSIPTIRTYWKRNPVNGWGVSLAKLVRLFV